MTTKVDPKSEIGKFLKSRNVDLSKVSDKNLQIAKDAVAKAAAATTNQNRQDAHNALLAQQTTTSTTVPSFTVPPVGTGAAGAATTIPAAPLIPTAGSTGPQLQGAETLSNLYGGVTYDMDKIKAILDAGTTAAYDLKKKEAAAAEGTYADMLYGAGMTARDAIRKQASAAVATGASRGMQAAQELSSILGLEQTGVSEATTLMQNRQKLNDEMAAEIAKNAASALSTSNAAKMALGTLGSNLYAADTQKAVGDLDYLARIDAATKAAEASKYTADKAYAGTELTTKANIEAAKIAAAASAAASKNYSGASSGSKTTEKQPTLKEAIDKAYKAGDVESLKMYMRSGGFTETEIAEKIAAMKKALEKNKGQGPVQPVLPTLNPRAVLFPGLIPSVPTNKNDKAYR